jgi:rhodanese-related sulfurtransferase
MKKFFSNLSLNKKLILIVLLFGFIAIFAGSPYKGSKVTLDSKELALIVQKEVDHVSVEDLADWIIQGKADYRLIDLRSEKEFNEYHIQTAENISLADLDKSNLGRNEKLVLYSEGGIHSSQAWLLLKAKDYKGVYMLTGGLDEWKDKILFPSLPDSVTNEQKSAFEKKKEISKFFGGVPRTSSGDETKQNMPKLDLPKMDSPGNTPTQPTGKKKKEGC